MFYLELLLFMQGLLVILMFIFLHKMNRVKAQIDNITKEVSKYLNFIEEEISQEEVEKIETKMEKRRKISPDEAQNHVIQAVLKEYFP